MTGAYYAMPQPGTMAARTTDVPPNIPVQIIKQEPPSSGSISQVAEREKKWNKKGQISRIHTHLMGWEGDDAEESSHAQQEYKIWRSFVETAHSNNEAMQDYLFGFSGFGDMIAKASGIVIARLAGSQSTLSAPKGLKAAPGLRRKRCVQWRNFVEASCGGNEAQRDYLNNFSSYRDMLQRVSIPVLSRLGEVPIASAALSPRETYTPPIMSPALSPASITGKRDLDEIDAEPSPIRDKRVRRDSAASPALPWARKTSKDFSIPPDQRRLSSPPAHGPESDTCYTIVNDIQQGIFTSWKTCEEQLKACPGAGYKKWDSLNHAVKYIKLECGMKGEYRDWLDPEPITTLPVPPVIVSAAPLEGFDHDGWMAIWAVAKGRRPGFYKSLQECREQVTGFKRAIYKRCRTKTSATTFMQKMGVQIDKAVSPMLVAVPSSPLVPASAPTVSQMARIASHSSNALPTTPPSLVNIKKEPDSDEDELSRRNTKRVRQDSVSSPARSSAAQTGSQSRRVRALKREVNSHGMTLRSSASGRRHRSGPATPSESDVFDPLNIIVAAQE